MEKTEKHLFRFRRFSLTDSRSALKIGTDGVLLGAWADATGSSTLLDVGAGCGLIALMMAQRFPYLQIDAIETDANSLEDAVENISGSPFSQRVNAFQGDFRTYDFPRKYDFVVSNPPFFTEDTLSPDTSRASARNACSLPPDILAERTRHILSEKGKTAVIYPCVQAETIIDIFRKNGLSLYRRTDVKGTPLRPFKRSLLAFSLCSTADILKDELCICHPDGQRSEQYKELTREFHPF